MSSLYKAIKLSSIYEKRFTSNHATYIIWKELVGDLILMAMAMNTISTLPHCYFVYIYIVYSVHATWYMSMIIIIKATKVYFLSRNAFKQS